jgi:adenine-specific DNA methylase
VSGLPVEKNIFKGLRRKMKTITEAFSTVASSRSSVTVVNGTSTALYLEDGSVDYVFTDPPFGNYIPYAEVNQINELWLGVVTKQSDEIIISPAQGKDVTSYGEMMRAVFSELSRVLRTSGRATVAFHSAKASVWQALIDAYSAAGLAPVAVSVLDKTQTSFKQAVSDVVVKGDPLILLSRVGGEACTRGEISITDIIASVLDEARRSGEAEERKRERLFSRFVARCLILGLPVTIDAGEFYRMARLDRDIA